MERKILTSPCEAWVGGDSFVQVMDVSISGVKTDLSLEIHVMNVHTVELKGIEFEALFFDSANNLLTKEPQIIKSENISIGTRKIGRASRYPLKDFSLARKAQIKLLKGYYEDGNVLDLIYEKMEKIIFNPLDKKERELLQKALGEDAYTLSKEEEGSWRCVCGYYNGYSSSECSNCSRSRDLVLAKYSDFTSILAILEEMENRAQEPEEEKPPMEEGDPPAEEPDVPTKGMLAFLSEIPKWILILLFVSGVLCVSALFIFVMH